MNPINFKEANKRLTKPSNMSNKECEPMWIYTDGEQCLSCWKLSFKDRIKAFLFGKVWLCILSGETQPPVWLNCDKTVFVANKK